jgi:hypothetical protein
MSNPAFIVDGFTEKLLIQKICPHQPIRRTDLNGKSASLNAISKRISSLIRLLGNRYYPIIILVDKEDRDIHFRDMANEIISNIKEEGFQDCDIRIGIPDRMIENWIIADWNSVSTKPMEIKNTESINGAAIIRRINGNYDKTTDGVDFFLKCDQSRIYNKSESYRYFIDQLDGIECTYLKFRLTK